MCAFPPQCGTERGSCATLPRSLTSWTQIHTYQYTPYLMGSLLRVMGRARRGTRRLQPPPEDYDVKARASGRAMRIRRSALSSRGRPLPPPQGRLCGRRLRSRFADHCTRVGLCCYATAIDAVDAAPAGSAGGRPRTSTLTRCVPNCVLQTLMSPILVAGSKTRASKAGDICPGAN